MSNKVRYGLPIFLPWAKERADFAFKHAREGLFMLDVQLGSECNALCPRCDSSCSDKKQPSNIDIPALVGLAAAINNRHRSLLNNLGEGSLPGGTNLGFICGLGEPTIGENSRHLRYILDNTMDHEFSWSIFTNGLCWDEELDSYVEEGYLFPIVQYNSNKIDTTANMLGVSSGRATTQLENRYFLENLVEDLNLKHIERTGENFTSMAASIVPERDNLDEIPELVQDCLLKNVFPLIAELENAGNAKDGYYDQQKLSDAELASLHQRIEEEFRISYSVPICPATIGAIHINNQNIVTVDEFTGLSCGWFNLGDQKVHEIGDIREMTYDEIVSAILEYRESRIPEVRRALERDQYPDSVFGGCSGNARKLLFRYVSLYYDVPHSYFV